MSLKCSGDLIICARDMKFGMYVLKHNTNLVTFSFFDNSPYIMKYRANKMAVGSDVTKIKDFLDMIPNDTVNFDFIPKNKMLL